MIDEQAKACGPTLVAGWACVTASENLHAAILVSRMVSGIWRVLSVGLRP